MDKITLVKEQADIIRVAEYFNIKSKQCCPFHTEKHASFSISKSKQIFKCFSCGKGGDVITLVSELLNVNAYESAKHINNILGLNIDFKQNVSRYEIERYKQKQKTKQAFENWENNTFRLLTDYRRLLLNQIDYVERDSNLAIIDYYLDIFTYGTNKEKLFFWKNNKKVVKRIEQRLRK